MVALSRQFVKEVSFVILSPQKAVLTFMTKAHREGYTYARIK